ncbi:MAG TPA: hypothetical protein VFH51_20120, partial [Myxococcota bacterium]|nr:hypothetical protein [Myxococcota bacterium]
MKSQSPTSDLLLLRRTTLGLASAPKARRASRQLEALDLQVKSLPLTVPPMRTLPRSVAPTFEALKRPARLVTDHLLQDRVTGDLIVLGDEVVAGGQGAFQVGLALDPNGVVPQVFGIKRTPRHKEESLARESYLMRRAASPLAFHQVWETDGALFSKLPLCDGDLCDAFEVLWSRHCNDVSRVAFDVLRQLS